MGTGVIPFLFKTSNFLNRYNKKEIKREKKRELREKWKRERKKKNAWTHFLVATFHLPSQSYGRKKSENYLLFLWLHSNNGH